MLRNTRKILIVDDEKPIQEVVQLCLEMLRGWQVYTASSGHEGLQIAEMEQPDAILLDMSMAGMDGITTFQKLRQNPATQKIPVILLTAHVQPDTLEHITELGFTGVIMKPFDSVQLADQVIDILGWPS